MILILVSDDRDSDLIYIHYYKGHGFNSLPLYAYEDIDLPGFDKKIIDKGIPTNAKILYATSSYIIYLPKDDRRYFALMSSSIWNDVNTDILPKTTFIWYNGYNTSIDFSYINLICHNHLSYYTLLQTIRQKEKFKMNDYPCDYCGLQITKKQTAFVEDGIHYHIPCYNSLCGDKEKIVGICHKCKQPVQKMSVYRFNDNVYHKWCR